jgi:F-type H+-transporting ATPase subunit b
LPGEGFFLSKNTKVMGFVTPDYGTIFWMLIIFGIVLFILKKFAWKPILKALKDREKSIGDALKSAEKARKEVAGLKASNDQIIAEARKEKELILKEARDMKDKILAEAKIQANTETQKSIENARQQIVAEKNAAINDIKKQVAQLSISIAEKVIKKELDKPNEQEILVDSMLKDLKLK